MGRPGKAARPYEMRVHRTRGYTYAATVDYLPAAAGHAARYRWRHWGTLDGRMRFTPNASFMLLAPEERGRMVFPETWDVSALQPLVTTPGPVRPACGGGAGSGRFCGDAWLCRQLAAQLGLDEDLLTAFGGSRELRDEVLELAICLVCAAAQPADVGEWQGLVKSPADRTLTPLRITRLTQAITAAHTAALLRCRALRQGPDALLAAASTVRGACGCTQAGTIMACGCEDGCGLHGVEVVGYSLRGHQPLYCRTLPGSMTGTRTLEAITRDLEAAGFRDTVLVADCGHEGRTTLLGCISRGQKLITAVPVTCRHILRQVRRLGAGGIVPRDMDFDLQRGLCLRRYGRRELGGWAKELGLTARQAARLQLTLGLDPEVRLATTAAIYAQLQRQGEELAAMRRERALPCSRAGLQRGYPGHDLTFSTCGTRLTAYAIRGQRLERHLQAAGFFALLSWGVAAGAGEIADGWRLRQRQESCRARMRSLLAGRTRCVWQHAGAHGRELLLLSAGVILARLEQVRSAELRHDFGSVHQMLNCMRRLRGVRQAGPQPHLTAAAGEQLRICRALGVGIPPGRMPGAGEPP